MRTFILAGLLALSTVGTAFAGQCPVYAYGQVVGCPLPSTAPRAASFDTHATTGNPYVDLTTLSVLAGGGND